MTTPPDYIDPDPYAQQPQGGQWAWVPDQPPAPRPNRATKAVAGVMAGIVGLIALVLCGAGVLWATGGFDKPEPPEAGARVACIEAINAQLKAPSTADYSGVTASHRDDQWTVTGAVDAQNSFGAKLRSNFRCELSYDSAAKRFTVNDTSIAAP